MTTPATSPIPAPGLRASDAEREAVADRLRAAAADGRLTMAEADERQAVAYAAVTREELVPLTADLPGPEPDPATQPVPRRRGGPLTAAARRRLAVHAAIVGVLAVFLVTRWAMGPVAFFWPAWPMLWLGLSVLLHHRWAPRDAAPPTVPATI
ncbi:DUF1707 SHOCT-like domain-containing protein [Pseudonocardia kunmingensis]|uniref:Uncharacterized protein DUF1707 n=1 Tax=Pseudonocardia kunmingensis TaxID=630975 RepID=A0A543D168_9PSEU|nr:DUF1707 domain-containing protein [Pseudonocardia kunmingensis]TQM03079.1 uncharacterized protein DUF1707 [Pseudonocardia kunmingensis]